jgi:hypothetical protein
VDTETSPLLLVLTLRPEQDHPAWGLKEAAARELPHRTRELRLEALSGGGGRELLRSLIGGLELAPEIEWRILEPAEGNPFFLEEIVRSLVDSGALVHEDDGWRFDHEIEVEVPPTVEKVIVARIDRLDPGARDALLAAAVLGRSFGLSHLEAVADDGDIGRALVELQRLDLVREGRRWPEPESGSNTLIQDAAYRTLAKARRAALHRRAAAWLEARYAGREDEVAGLLAHHWLAAADEDKAVAYLARAGDRARQEYALDEAVGYYRELLPILERRGAAQEMALVLFALALALHMSLGSVRRTTRTSEPSPGLRRSRRPSPRPRSSRSRPASCRTTPTRAPRSRGPTSSSACSCSTGWWSNGPSARSSPRSPIGGRSPTTVSATSSTSGTG